MFRGIRIEKKNFQILFFPMEMPLCFPFFHHGDCIFFIMHHFLKMVDVLQKLNFDYGFYTKFHYIEVVTKLHFGDVHQLYFIIYLNLRKNACSFQ